MREPNGNLGLQRVAVCPAGVGRAQLEALLTLAASQKALGRDRHAVAAVDHARENRPGLNTDALRDDLPYRDQKALDRFIEELKSSGLD